jgi:hypothetical protein
VQLKFSLCSLSHLQLDVLQGGESYFFSCVVLKYSIFFSSIFYFFVGVNLYVQLFFSINDFISFTSFTL